MRAETQERQDETAQWKRSFVDHQSKAGNGQESARIQVSSAQRVLAVLSQEISKTIIWEKSCFEERFCVP